MAAGFFTCLVVVSQRLVVYDRNGCVWRGKAYNNGVLRMK